MIDRSRTRVGVIGCGLVAQVMHLPNLRELGDRFDVTAVCDLAPGPLEFAGAMFPDARRHTDWEDALVDVDAVLVLTAGSHARSWSPPRGPRPGARGGGEKPAFTSSWRSRCASRRLKARR